MLARSYRDIGYFDRAIGELKSHFNRLLRPAAKPARRGPQRRKKGEVSCLTSTGSPCWPRIKRGRTPFFPGLVVSRQSG